MAIKQTVTESRTNTLKYSFNAGDSTKTWNIERIQDDKLSDEDTFSTNVNTLASKIVDNNVIEGVTSVNYKKLVVQTKTPIDMTPTKK